MNSLRLMRKDLLLMFRDKYALLILLGMPLCITAIVCSAAIQFADSVDPDSLQLAVLDRDRTEASRSLLAELETPRGEVRHVSETQLRELVYDQGWNAGIIIEAGFARHFDDLQLLDLLDISQSRLTGSLSSFGIRIVSRQLARFDALIVSQFVSLKLMETAHRQILDESPILKTYVEANSTRPSRDRGWVRDMLSAIVVTREQVYFLVIPAQAVLFAFFLVNVMARSFVTERVRGTLQRLRMTPTSRLSLILGKTVPFLLVSILQGVLLFVSARFIFGMPLGDHLSLLALVIFCTSLSATALGLVISLVVGTDYQVNVLATFLVLVMAAISGCLMPREFLPHFLQTMSLYLTPHAWSLAAYEELFAGATPDLGRVLRACFWLLAFSFGFGLLSWWKMRKSDLGLSA